MVDFVSLSTIVPSLLSNYYASSSIAKPLSPPSTRSTWRLPADKSLLEANGGTFATLWDPDNDRPLPKPLGLDSPRSAAAAALATEEEPQEALSPLAQPPPPELEAALASVTVTSMEPLTVAPTVAHVAGMNADGSVGGTGGVVMMPRAKSHSGGAPKPAE